MLFRDRVRVWLNEDGGTDRYGNPEKVWTDKGQVPAEVRPLSSEAHYDESFALSRYRIVLAPKVAIPPTIGTDLRIEWRGFSGRDEGAAGLNVDGTVESHVLGGKLHHYEITTQAVST
jgi:head-tail adaptor